MWVAEWLNDLLIYHFDGWKGKKFMSDGERCEGEWKNGHLDGYGNKVDKCWIVYWFKNCLILQ